MPSGGDAAADGEAGDGATFVDIEGGHAVMVTLPSTMIFAAEAPVVSASSAAVLTVTASEVMNWGPVPIPFS